MAKDKVEAHEISELSKIRKEYLVTLENVAKAVAKKLSDYNGKVYDTLHKRGHEESNLDIKAYEWMTGSLEDEMRLLDDEKKFRGQMLYELKEIQEIENKKKKGVSGVMIIDEIDGTTNTKRAKGSIFEYDPRACISISLCDNKNLDSILMGVVHDLHNNNTYSAVKFLENDPKSFLAFRDKMLLDPNDFNEKKGDSCYRIMVVGYSNTERKKKSDIELAIINIDKEQKEYRVYDGSRSSANDILNIINNQYDAYVDPRALWGKEKGALLEPYDVAGVIPIAYGCGLEVSDIFGKPIENYVQGEPLTLIISRKGLNDKIVEALKPLLLEQDFITKK